MHILNRNNLTNKCHELTVISSWLSLMLGKHFCKYNFKCIEFCRRATGFYRTLMATMKCEWYLFVGMEEITVEMKRVVNKCFDFFFQMLTWRFIYLLRNKLIHLWWNVVSVSVSVAIANVFAHKKDNSMMARWWICTLLQHQLYHQDSTSDCCFISSTIACTTKQSQWKCEWNEPPEC